MNTNAYILENGNAYRPSPRVYAQNQINKGALIYVVFLCQFPCHVSCWMAHITFWYKISSSPPFFTPSSLLKQTILIYRNCKTTGHYALIRVHIYGKTTFSKSPKTVTPNVIVIIKKTNTNKTSWSLINT